MKPIAIFQHYPGATAGHFLQFAHTQRLPVKVFCGYGGEALPDSIKDFSGLVSMGGPMSVNDRLGFIEHEAKLMEEALALEKPIMGHCLGSQLLARALGAEISANRPAAWEIGWFPVQAAQTQASAWTEAFKDDEVFHWHNENFSLPEGATRLLGNSHCLNQAFLHGPHLGMQFHIEITEAMVKDWCSTSEDPINWRDLPSVQSVQAMQSELTRRVERSNAMADFIYRRWSRALFDKE